MYNQSLDENVQYIESRQAFDVPECLYVIDESGEYNETNGKRFLNNEKGALEINITLELIHQFMEQHPEFIGHKRIFQTVRVTGQDVVNVSMQDALD